MKNLKWNNLCFAGFGALGLLFAPGCLSTSALQTARTLDAGQSRFHIGGGLYSSPSFDEDVESITGGDPDISLPFVEFAYRIGIVEDLELGAKLTLPGTFTVDGKYQLLDEDTLALAAGLGVGYLSVESTVDGSDEQFQIIDVTVPVYASYHPAETFAVYLSPKYVLRSSEGMTHHGGVTGGIRLGNKAGLFLETTYMSSFSDDFTTLQYNGSLFFNL